MLKGYVAGVGVRIMSPTALSHETSQPILASLLLVHNLFPQICPFESSQTHHKFRDKFTSINFNRSKMSLAIPTGNTVFYGTATVDESAWLDKCKDSGVEVVVANTADACKYRPIHFCVFVSLLRVVYTICFP